MDETESENNVGKTLLQILGIIVIVIWLRYMKKLCERQSDLCCSRLCGQPSEPYNYLVEIPNASIQQIPIQQIPIQQNSQNNY
ncbi:MAG TPA: hypothetical protein VI821_03985 [Candidatus Paceibacterota bacterium]